jgi:hypothetical protein
MILGWIFNFSGGTGIANVISSLESGAAAIVLFLS